METNPSRFQGGRFVDSQSHPVEQVSWNDAVKFCERLSELPDEKNAGRVYRWPPEAEWEYACRPGSPAAYAFGDDPESLVDYAWFSGNSRHTNPVGQKEPNAWGLHDMHGNTYEWCADWYGDYPSGPVTDPIGAEAGVGRVYRGGSWGGEAAFCKSSYRVRGSPTYGNINNGFRVAMSPLNQVPAKSESSVKEPSDLAADR